jgi:3-oxoacyl-[acyl-carrier-protein] synthase III
MAEQPDQMMHSEPPTAAFGRFVALTEVDAASLLERMSNHDLRADGERYGIVQRLIARPGVLVVDLAVAVLRKLFETTSISADGLGAIVLASRNLEPTLAPRQVAELLGATCPAEGIARACSGFPAATRLATELCQTIGMPVAVVAAEIASLNINWEPVQGDADDQKRARGQTAKLFGEGAAAVLIGPRGVDYPHEILNAWQSDVPDERQSTHGATSALA